VLLILEGPDLSGKSTLAEALPGRVVHHGPPGDRSIVEVYAEDIERYKPDGCDSIVFDRLHLGEMVYGPLKRGQSRLTTLHLDWFRLLIQSRGGFVVVLLPPKNVLERRLLYRIENFVSLDELYKVHDAYVPLGAEYANWVVDSAEFKTTELTQILQRLELEAEPLINWPRYGGPPKPDVLLVGDRPSDNRRKLPERLIPFTPEPGTSGEFLFKALRINQLRHYGLTNSHETDVRGLWKTLSSPKTVALGNQAARALTEAGVPHTKVYHPQYARRFEHSALGDYATEIHRACQS
jgi:hypothetical protein